MVKSRKSSAPRASSPDSRQQLLDVAIRLFGEKGFDATTTRDIVDASGLNISLISYYFGGKDGLLEACLDWVHERLRGVIGTASLVAIDQKDFFRRLGGIVDAFLDSHAKYPHMHRLVQREQERDSPIFSRFVREKYSQEFADLASFLQNGQEHGWLDPELDPTTAAIALHGAMVQQVRLDRFRRELQGKSLADQQQRATVVRDVIAIFSRGLSLSS